MRDYKFRGKSLANGEWIFGSLYNDGGEDYILPNIPASAIDYELYQVDLNTIGQYTGLKDPNKKEIYEGDIIIINRYDSHEIVEWNDELGFFALRSPGCKIGIKPLGEWMEEFDLFLVGNIYDNKELLSEK